MKRKNWIKKKQNNYLFDNLIYKYYFFDLYNLNQFIIKNYKNVNKKNTLNNYKLYLFFLNSFKQNKTNFLIRNFLQINSRYLLVKTLFNFQKQFFPNYLFFINFLKKNLLKGFFFNKKFFLKNFENNFYISGFNFWIYNFDNNKIDFLLNLSTDNEKKNKDLFIYKNDFQHALIVYCNLNYINLNYNVFLLNILELYKIYIYIYLNKIGS